MMKVYVIQSEVFSGSWGENSYSYFLISIVRDKEKAKKLVDEITKETLDEERISDDEEECPYPKIDESYKCETEDEYAKRIIRSHYEDEDYEIISSKMYEVE